MEKISLALQEEYHVVLQGRGAMGIQLKARQSDENVTKILREEAQRNQNHAIAGSLTEIIFKIIAIKEGKSNVTFFETQPWNLNFPERIIRELFVCVEE